MAASSIVQVVVLLVWACVLDAPTLQKNPTYDLVMTNLCDMRYLIESAALIFAPGLYNVLKAPTPPTIEYFKQLPLVSGKLWAVYVLTLEKFGHRPKIYIDSGTNQQEGVVTRMRSYDNDYLIPSYVAKALKGGYEITHKGFLCWTAIPSPAQHFASKLVILALEAMFSFHFWAMVSRSKDYQMVHARDWALDTYTYDGCCSHSALLEGLGLDGLTQEQVTARIAQVVEITS